MTEPAKPRPLRSGPSGDHKMPRYLLSFENDEQRERWERAAEKDGRTLASWLRHVADRAARK